MRRWNYLLLALLTAACGDTTDPIDDGATDEQLNFVRFASSGAVAERTKSFWAVRGEERELEIDYANGEDFLEFEVKDETLLRRPNGTAFAEGDSVLITVTLDPENRIVLDFQPSGLVFNPAEPARLKISYRQGDDDIDDDGDHDDEDERLEQRLRIWQRELPGQPWMPLATLRLDEDDLEARIFGFTGFAMASN